MSRTPQQVQAELLQLTPPGWAFPDDPDTYLGAELLGWSSEASRIETTIEAMLPQVDIRQATNLLPDYQRVLGPDPCNRDLSTLSFAQQAAIAFTQWTAIGNLCAGALIAIAASFGVVATVQESKGCICGAASCDDEMVPGGASFMFIVSLPIAASAFTNCECGAATCDDSLGNLTPSLAQCPITHATPLHALAAFNYIVSP